MSRMKCKMKKELPKNRKIKIKVLSHKWHPDKIQIKKKKKNIILMKVSGLNQLLDRNQKVNLFINHN